MTEKENMELREKACRELSEINRRQEMTPAMVESAYKLTSIAKNLDKMRMADKYAEDASYSYRDGSYHGYPMDYSGDYSGARRSRDSMGRYTSRGDRSWGEAKEAMVQQLSDMLSMAGNSREKEIVRRARDELKEM